MPADQYDGGLINSKCSRRFIPLHHQKIIPRFLSFNCTSYNCAASEVDYNRCTILYYTYNVLYRMYLGKI